MVEPFDPNQVVSILCGEPVARWTPVSGGDVHIAGRATLASGRVLFAKVHPGPPPELFAVEAEGLQWLTDVGGAPTPAVVAVSSRVEGPGGLVLDWVERCAAGDAHQVSLARVLADMHSVRGDRPGWTQDGFIGPLPQPNHPLSDSWPHFWRDRRLGWGLKLAAPHLSGTASALVSEAMERIDQLLMGHGSMAPLHGDLWSGNVVYGAAGPYLIDPAPYVGDPEVDLAMMSLFGGFGAAFWEAYGAARPQRVGWRRRRAVYQLWPLLVHVALFGRAYDGQLVATAQRALA